MDENWITKWHREDSYGPAAGRTPCMRCESSKYNTENGASVLRCSAHHNCRVNKDASCSKAAGVDSPKS